MSGQLLSLNVITITRRAFLLKSTSAKPISIHILRAYNKHICTKITVSELAEAFKEALIQTQREQD